MLSFNSDEGHILDSNHLQISDLQSSNDVTSIPHNESSPSQSQGPLSTEESFLSIALFVFAAFFEIGGGYLVWIAIRKKYQPMAMYLLLGFVSLCIYGLLPTLQPVDSFGRIFAVYGGFFIVLSYLWSVIFDDLKLDMGDYVGSAIALFGVALAWFWPR